MRKEKLRILLVRHGQSMGNLDIGLYKTTPDHNIPLSDLGHIQAVEAGAGIAAFYDKLNKEEGVKNRKIRLWTSPYLRTRQTADGIEKGSGGLITDRREHINLCEQQFGTFDGIEEDQLPTLFPETYKKFKLLEDHEGRFWARYPEGESRFDVAVRVHQAFGTFHRDQERHDINDVVIVCHGVTLRLFVMQWMHSPYEWSERERNPKNCSVRLLEGAEDKGVIFMPQIIT